MKVPALSFTLLSVLFLSAGCSDGIAAPSSEAVFSKAQANGKSGKSGRSGKSGKSRVVHTLNGEFGDVQLIAGPNVNVTTANGVIVIEATAPSGGGLTRTVFSGHCLPNGGFNADGIAEDGDVIFDATITLADLPLVRAYVHKPNNLLLDAFETHRDGFFILEGKFIISCPGGTEPGLPAWDYKIVMIK